jgi:hypothetical protein
MAGGELARGVVAAVCKSDLHSFSKARVGAITLLAGPGVEGDAHLGRTVQHRSRVAADPSQPNLRQVHLIHEALHAELGTQGFLVGPGALGENITTRGVTHDQRRRFPNSWPPPTLCVDGKRLLRALPKRQQH